MSGNQIKLINEFWCGLPAGEAGSRERKSKQKESDTCNDMTRYIALLLDNGFCVTWKAILCSQPLAKNCFIETKCRLLGFLLSGFDLSFVVLRC